MKRLFITFLLLASVASADTVRTIIQNDVFLPKNHDRFYSNGLRVEYENSLFGIAAAQYMYTPADKDNPDIAYGDRPYCGYLYIAGFKEFNYKINSLYTELQLGTVGEYSYAGKTQNQIHKWIGSRYCAGWDHQIEDEFIMNAYVQDKVTFSIIDKIFQIIPQGGVAFGNYYDGLNVGGTFKIGYNLPKDKMRTIEPIVSAPRFSNWSAYIFVKPEMRYVIHNTSLEGSIFDSNESEYTVKIEPIVWDVTYGVGLEYKLVNFEFQITDRSDEFKGQDVNGDFGSISVSISF